MQGGRKPGDLSLTARRAPQLAQPRRHLHDRLEGTPKRRPERRNSSDPCTSSGFDVAGDQDSAHRVTHEIDRPVCPRVPCRVVVSKQGCASDDLSNEVAQLLFGHGQRLPPVVRKSEHWDGPVRGRREVVPEILDEVAIGKAENFVDYDTRGLPQLVAGVVRV